MILTFSLSHDTFPLSDALYLLLIFPILATRDCLADLLTDPSTGWKTDKLLCCNYFMFTTNDTLTENTKPSIRLWCMRRIQLPTNLGWQNTILYSRYNTPILHRCHDWIKTTPVGKNKCIDMQKRYMPNIKQNNGNCTCFDISVNMWMLWQLRYQKR